MVEKLGRYEILEEVGQGGFAIVHRGRDTTLDRVIALKELRPILLNDTEWVKRFRREARTIAQLDHPRIVTIYDVYEPENRLCIVMRFVDGPSLDELINQRGALPWSETFSIMTAVAEGLDYAHVNGVLHRDLKPANILIDPERGPMLTDFGLAKLAGENSTSFTASGAVVGTPHYIAPEVWEGQGTTRQSDIYALGCILFEMLTGEKVFKGETPPAVMMAHFKPLALPSLWPGDIPIGVSEILQIALAHQPADRYSTAGEMGRALDRLFERNGHADSLLRQGVDLPNKGQTQPLPADSLLQSATASQGGGQNEVKTQTGKFTPQMSSYSAAEQIEHQPQPDGAANIADPTVPQERVRRHTQPLELPQTSLMSTPLPNVAAKPSASPWAERLSGWRTQRRSGCWISVGVGVALLLLGIIMIGNFCSALSNGISALFRPLQTGSIVEQSFNVPPPDSDQTPVLEIDIKSGNLTVGPGAADMALLEGSAAYNASALGPNIIVKDNIVRIQPEGDIGLRGFATENLENRLDLKLGSMPMELAIHTGGTVSDIDLGGLSILELKITQGAANFSLDFSKPNRTQMGTLEYSGGASNATLADLSNAQARNLVFQGGVGNYTLDFGGLLQDDMQVKIEGGVGSITVIVPADRAAEFTVNNGSLSNLNVSGAWQEVDGMYIISGDGPKLFMQADFDIGSLQLQSR